MSIANTLIEEDGFGFVQRPDNAVSKRRCYDVVRRLINPFGNDCSTLETGTKYFDNVLIDRTGPFHLCFRYTMTNRGNSSVRLISWGAGIQSVKIPNDKGVLGDVVLGFDTVDGYLENSYNFAKLIGKVANSVSADVNMSAMNLREQRELIEGKKEPNSLDNGNWESCVIGQRVVMSNLCTTNHDNRRGVMMTQTKFSWTDENELHLNIRATCTAPTPVNVATRCLFNLAGHGSGPNELRNHIVTVNAGKWTFVDLRDRIPTGEIRPVNSTVYDLRIPTRLTAERLCRVPGGGYDHNLCVDAPSCWCYRFHARMLHPGSGRFVEVYSNQPGLRFYTGNDLPELRKRYKTDIEKCCSGGCGDRSNSSGGFSQRENFEILTRPREIRGKGGVLYRRHGGFMLSPQNYPNAVNVGGFPKCILYPGKTYVHDMTYKFGVHRKI